MKRRTFLWMSFAGTAGLSLTLINCNVKNDALVRVLAHPQILAHFCDAGTLKAIGKAYREKMPAENEEDKLIKLLLTDSTGKPIPEITPYADLHPFLQKSIKHNFRQGSIVTLHGWIISVTEARQCALFSFV